MYDNIDNVLTALEGFKQKSKFEHHEDFLYSGVSDSKLRFFLNNVVNNLSDSFAELIKKNPTDEKYKEILSSTILEIEEGEFLLDTEDKERVCSYFEEIMDIVGLQSSGGILNNWLYGFDPLNME